MDAIPFRTIINVVKAVEEDGNKYLIAESSGPELDASKQFMTEDCIEDMAAQINRRSIPYYDEHNKRLVHSQLGDVVTASVTPEYHLLTKTLLDPINPIATMLWEKVKQGKQYGQSIAGHALAYAKKSLPETGEVLKGFRRIKLDHIANTTRPQWQHGLGTMIAKSQDWEDLDWEEVEEYEDELPFMEKASKPDPKAGEKARVVNSLQKLLAMLAGFDWKSYKEYIATTNRDNISLEAPDTGGVGGPVGDYAKSYDEQDAGWLEYVEKATPQSWNVEDVANTYQRLSVVAKALPEDDDLLAQANGLVDTLKDVLSTPPVEVKAYNTDVVVKSAEEVTALDNQMEVEAVSGLDGYLSSVEQMGGQVLKDFGAVNEGIGQVETKQLAADLAKSRPAGPEPGAMLTDFSQVAQVPQSEAVEKDEGAADTVALLQRYWEEITKSDAALPQKKAALQRLMEGTMTSMMDELTQSASPEERSGMFVEKAVIPVLEKLDERLNNIESQLAVLKSSGGEAPAQQETLVRKSIAPQVRPSRSVTRNERATFRGLILGDQYMEVEE